MAVSGALFVKRRPVQTVLEDTIREQVTQIDALRREVARLTREAVNGRVLRDEIRAVRGQLSTTERELEIALGLPRHVDTAPIRPSASTKTGEACAVLVASDWHIEEPVDSVTVNRQNFYNLAESKRRAEIFFANGLKLVRVHQAAIAIPRMIVPILGDMITGSIHPDTAESNLLPPAAAIERCAEYLCSGFEFLLRETKAEGMQFTVPMHTGNHGRMTRELRVHTEHGNSLERLMYALVIKHFRAEPRILFHLAPGNVSYLNVYDYTLRFHHGHGIRYAGGVGGLAVPAYKWIARQQRGRSAHWDVFGHHHTCLDGGTFLSNGSMIGWNLWAQHNGYAFEKPQQQWFLIDKRRGKRAVDPIMFN